MHIEPGLVDGAKLLLSAGTATATIGLGLRFAWQNIKESGLASVGTRSLLAISAVLVSFQLLPHPPVGVSEVHIILGTSLFLILGAGPAAIGLAIGLLMQGLMFEPIDLPQYGMNVTTLLAPLLALSAVASRIVAPGVAYVDLSYSQVLKMSAVYQAGIVGWVAFWVIYGGDLSVSTFASLATFGVAYMSVILLEPVVDLALLAAAKSAKGKDLRGLVTPRLQNAA